MAENTNRLIIEAEEDFLIDAQFLIQELMEKKGLTRKELAQRAGISMARLSQLFRAEANPTAKTFARLFYALGERAEICVGRKAHEDANFAGEWEFGTAVASPPERSSESKRLDWLQLAKAYAPRVAGNDNPVGNVRMWNNDTETLTLEAA